MISSVHLQAYFRYFKTFTAQRSLCMGLPVPGRPHGVLQAL